MPGDDNNAAAISDRLFKGDSASSACLICRRRIGCDSLKASALRHVFFLFAASFFFHPIDEFRA